MGGLTCFQLGLKYPEKFRGTIMFCPAIKDISDYLSFGKSIVKFVGKIFPTVRTVR